MEKPAFQIGEEHESAVTLYHPATKSHVIVRLPLIDNTGRSLGREDINRIREQIKALVARTMGAG